MHEPPGADAPLTLFGTLRLRLDPLWRRAQEHPFVHGLGDGSLSRARFSYFLRQDYAYLAGYSRAWAVAAAKAGDLALLEECAGLVSDTLEMEMQVHREYCAEFGISEAELESVEPGPVCQAYIDFGLAAAHQGDVLELCCALAPCGVGYAEIGARLRPAAGFSNGMSHHPFKQWIETYAGEEFQRYASWLIEKINTLGAGLLVAAAAAQRELAEAEAQALAELAETGEAGADPAAADDPGTDTEQDLLRGAAEQGAGIEGVPLSWAEQKLERLARLMRLGCRYEWLFWEAAWNEERWPV